MDEFNRETAAVLAGGSVEYDPAAAAVPIDDLIAALQAAKEDGAETVLMASGNYRGAQWASVGTDWSWASEDAY